MEAKSYVAKLIVGGEGGVGKSCLLYRYCNNTFKADSKITIGVGFLAKKVNLAYEGQAYDINYSIWDLGGQKRFQFMHADYTVGAEGFIVAFDMTRFDTLATLDAWMDIFNPPKRFNPNTLKPTIIIGTKKDLWDPRSDGVQRREIDKKVAHLKAKYQFSDSLLKYFDTSSKTGEGVKEVFDTLGQMYLENITKHAYAAPIK